MAEGSNFLYAWGYFGTYNPLKQSKLLGTIKEIDIQNYGYDKYEDRGFKRLPLK